MEWFVSRRPGLRVQPALKLLPVSEAEDAYNPSLDISLAAVHAHDAERTKWSSFPNTSCAVSQNPCVRGSLSYSMRRSRPWISPNIGTCQTISGSMKVANACRSPVRNASAVARHAVALGCSADISVPTHQKQHLGRGGLRVSEFGGTVGHVKFS
jgi:uncharacterized Fe-S cluster protein YjdI